MQLAQMARAAHKHDCLAAAGDTTHEAVLVAQRLGQTLLLPVHHLEELGVVVGPAHADLRIESGADLVHLSRAQAWCVRGPQRQEAAKSGKEALCGEVVGRQDQTWPERLL